MNAYAVEFKTVNGYATGILIESASSEDDAIDQASAWAKEPVEVHSIINMTVEVKR